MHPLLTNLLHGRSLLIAVAAPVEVRGVFAGLGVPDAAVPALWDVADLSPAAHLLFTGVSKANAAGALARVLVPGHPYGCVVNMGVAGALPAERPLRVGGSITATSCVFADEGLQLRSSFQTLAEMGFPLDPTLGTREAFMTDPVLQSVFQPLTDAAGAVATVSTCSGTDELAGAVAARTGALAETMEGAALALVARRCGVPFCEVRTISNLTGERSAQRWDLGGAVARLSDIVRAAFG